MRFITTITLLFLAITPMFSAEPAAPEGPLFVLHDRCMACHNNLTGPAGDDISIGTSWRGSMMAHSAQDPYWQAAVRRESMEHPKARRAIEDKCATCHMPMARFTAKAHGETGTVFNHLPITHQMTDEDTLAASGVSCTMCHQITGEKLGTEESFTGGFVVDTAKALGERNVYGPFEIDEGRTRVMRSSAQMVPTQSDHLKDAAFCASCHTLYTHALDSAGNIAGELPEQVPYLEWRHSIYKGNKTCQSCHMPEATDETPITSVLAQKRNNFSKHIFRGGNFFMPKILNQHRLELGVKTLPQTLTRTASETLTHLKTKAARVEIENAGISKEKLGFDVAVENLAGHKVPTAYPSRRAWLKVQVTDTNGRVVFSSGALKSDGSIEGNDNDANPVKYEPHYTQITSGDEVQIYEAIMADHKGSVTTGLLSGVRYVKDNRLLPMGFDKQSAEADIAVQGAAAEDPDFQQAGDTVKYLISVDKQRGPFRITATLWYQPISFRWAQNLGSFKARETQRFVRYFEALSEKSGTEMASDEKLVK